MEPVIAPLMSEIGFALGDLIGVMRKSIVDSSAVDVQIFAQILHAYAGALNVPAGISHAPGGIPFEFLIVEFGACEPEDEIGIASFVFIVFNAFTDTYGKIFLFKVIENIVLVEL